jgi:succinate dehydrogenase / fumarate reductase flavoprotein subunit
MWETCGVVRDGKRMQEGLQRLSAIGEAAKQLDVRPSSEGWQDLALALDLQGALAAAEATLRSAIERRESRGAHQRSDYPKLDPAQRINYRIRLDSDGNQALSHVNVPPIPNELVEFAESDPQLALKGRLLE